MFFHIDYRLQYEGAALRIANDYSNGALLVCYSASRIAKLCRPRRSEVPLISFSPMLKIVR